MEKTQKEKEIKFVNYIWRGQLVSVPVDKKEQFLEEKNRTEREN